jgi:signal transduction histidine kinase
MSVVIFASALASAMGFFNTYRAFREQIRLNELKSNFVSSVSHELRAPIASVRLLAEGLHREKVTGAAKQKEYFQFIVQECRRLSSLIENVLDFSRIEQGRKKYQFEPSDMLALARQTVQLLTPNAQERQVQLRLNETGNPPENPPFTCDGLAIQQALINLIDNALKHSPAGSEVVVGIESDAGEFRLWVEDKGPGIPPSEQEKIFERFYRLGSELRRETQGIGIGLSIVKHIMEAHGGHVQVRSEPGHGSRFTLVLKAASVPENTPS